MKVFITLLSLSILVISCTKESEKLRAALQNNNTPITMSSPALKRGTFSPTAGIQVMGVAKIIQISGALQVQLDSFSVSSGPDLKVYLSQAATPGNHLNLGNLKSNSGTQSYNIPTGTNVSDYSFVLIHCQQYNHLFSYAKLQ
jgi:hypothetical protein